MVSPIVLIHYQNAEAPDGLLFALKNKYQVIESKIWRESENIILHEQPTAVIALTKDKDCEFLNAFKIYNRQLPFALMVISPSYSIALERSTFKLGGDHYMLAATSIASLLPRIEQMISRMLHMKGIAQFSELPSSKWSAQKIVVHPFIADLKAETVYHNGILLRLSPIQAKLLITFLNSPNELLSRKALREGVWGANAEISDRSIDAHIAKLKKLVPELKNTLIGIYAKGYVLKLNQVNAA
jgi:DNA-binding response OmpR family regulator